MKNRTGFIGLVAIAAIIGAGLIACTSAPRPIGDASNPRDVLGGKSWETSSNGTLWTFNYDGTVSILNGTFFGYNVQNFPYTWDGSVGSVSVEGGQDFRFTLNSATDPTEMLVNGAIVYKRKL